MRFPFRAIRALTYSGMLAALSATASASIITAQFNSISPTNKIDASLDGGVNFYGYHPGPVHWSRVGGDYPGAQGDFDTFCIELTEEVEAAAIYSFDVVATKDAPSSFVGGMGQAKADLLAELFGQHHATLDLNDEFHVAAFQTAIWEIVYDDGIDLASGDFIVLNNTPVYALADAYLATLSGQGPFANLVAMRADCVQDQIIPEPASLALLLGGLAFALRRRSI